MRPCYNVCPFIKKGWAKKAGARHKGESRQQNQKFYMVLSKLKTKKNSDLKKKIGSIVTIGANIKLPTILKIFVLRDCSEKVFDTRKTKIHLLKQSEMDSSSVRHKIERPDVLTADVLVQGRPGLDFNDMKNVLEITKNEKDPVIVLIFADAARLSSEEDQAILGPTLGDQIAFLESKHGDNPEQLLMATLKALTERKRAIAKCLEELEKSSERGIAAKEDALTFSSLKSKQDISLLHLVSHQNPDPAKRLDIIFQKHIHEQSQVHENVISAGERARKYLPAILEAVCRKEPTGWFQKNGLICSNPENISQISFGEMTGIIEKAVREFDPQKTAASDFSRQEPQINHEMQSDTAMAMARA
jgi:hypothetical protein